MSSWAWTGRALTSSRPKSPSTRWTCTMVPGTLNNRQVMIQSQWRGVRTASVSTTSELKSSLHYAQLIRKTSRSRSFSNRTSLVTSSSNIRRRSSSRRRPRRSPRPRKASKKRRRAYVSQPFKNNFNRHLEALKNNIMVSPYQPDYSVQKQQESHSSTRLKNKTQLN